MTSIFKKIIAAILIAATIFIGVNNSQTSTKVDTIAKVTQQSLLNLNDRVSSLELKNMESTQTTGDMSVLGATLAIETPVAWFETSLANEISDTATTMTLNNATTRDGTALASSTYSFTIDEGKATKELVRADCTGTTCTNMQRGISVLDGTSTVTANRYKHRAGASVKITDAPLLLNLTRIINGIGTFGNTISYTSHPTFSIGTQIIDKTYADGLVAAGVATSTESNFGGVWLATALQQASSTDGTPNKPYVLQAKYATDTPLRGCAVGFTATAGAGCTPIARLDGKISPQFIATSSSNTYNFAANISFSGSTSMPYYFGDGSDGVVTISAGTTTLTRDMHYQTLTINSGTGIDPAGYKIFVKGTLTNNGTIGSFGNNGENGGNGGTGTNADGGGTGKAGGTAGTAGTGGAAMAGGTIAGSPAGVAGLTSAGGTGGNNQVAGGSANGAVGTVGEAKTSCIGTAAASAAAKNGGNGGTGGSGSGAGAAGGGSGTGGAGGGAGTCTLVSRLQVFPIFLDLYEVAGGSVTTLNTAKAAGAGSAGGGGGGGGGNGTGGAGGGGAGGGGGTGTTGRIIAVYAFNLVNNGLIVSSGGNGGNGGDGGNGGANAGADNGSGAGGGTGAGGNGGTGGTLVLVYRTITTGTLSVPGGLGGSAGVNVGTGGADTGPGTAGTSGSVGTAGLAGATGTIYQIQQ